MADDLVILYEDNHCLAVAKPAPLLTQGVPPGIPTLEAMAKAYLKKSYLKAGNVYLGIPHRLDRPVSGVVVFARNSKAARRLAEQFHERRVRKVYWALVEGDVQPNPGFEVKLTDEERIAYARGRAKRDIIYGKSMPPESAKAKTDKDSKPYVDKVLDRALEYLRGEAKKADAARGGPTTIPS